MKYEITKEQINTLASNIGEANKNYLKQWFPECFETKLESGKWYTNQAMDKRALFCFTGGYDINLRPLGYGFETCGKWAHDQLGWGTVDLKPATDSEVEAALINEAKKRGFKGNHIKLISGKIGESSSRLTGTYLYNDNRIMAYGDSGTYTLYKDGIWATLIPTMTQKEAEEKLGVKIV